MGGAYVLCHWATVALTFVALVAIIRTLHHTRRAADYTGDMLEEAKKTTAEAKRSTDVVERSFVIKDRAFITVSEFRVDPSRKNLNGEYNRYDVYPTWKNTGATPAINFINHISCEIVEDILSDDFSFAEKWSGGVSKPYYGTTIAPNAQIYASHSVLDIDQDKIFTPRKFLLYGWCEYSDVFSDERRRTEFADYVIPMSRDANGHIVFRFNLLDRHNGTDDSCLRKPTPYKHPE